MDVYRAIDATKRKIPARVLRYCKEQLYELVQSSEPEKKICVVDIDDIDKKEDVEFLVGVGVAKTEREAPASIGYATIRIEDVLEDILLDNKKYDPKQIVRNVLPALCKNTAYVPIFKYLRAIGIDSLEKYEKYDICLDKVVNKDIREYRWKMYSKAFFRNYRHKSLTEIISTCTPENASAYIPFVPAEKLDLEILKDFLLSNKAKFDYGNSSYASSFRKVAAIYDRMKWGWDF